MSFPQEGQTGQGEGQQGGSGQTGQGDYWQSEAKKAFSSRDAAKSEADQLRRQLADAQRELQNVRQQAQQATHGSLRVVIENAVMRSGSVVPSAYGDVADAVLRSVAIGDDGQPVVTDAYGTPRESKAAPGSPMTVDEAVSEFIASRPHLRRAFVPVGSGAALGSTGGTPRVFDINRLDDPAYAKAWKEADAEGFKAAWKVHLKAVAARPIR